MNFAGIPTNNMCPIPGHPPHLPALRDARRRRVRRRGWRRAHPHRSGLEREPGAPAQPIAPRLLGLFRIRTARACAPASAARIRPLVPSDREGAPAALRSLHASGGEETRSAAATAPADAGGGRDGGRAVPRR